MTDILLFRSPDSPAFEEAFRAAVLESFPPGGRIAVKLHMGEGHHHFDRDLARRLVSRLRECDLDPFLFDSPVMYPGSRHTEDGYRQQASENGFSESAVGCPIVISNESVPVPGRHLPVGVCQDLIDSAGVLVLSHFKGHPCSGAAGALKNLGMGGVDRESKGAMHEGAKPVLTGECSACGKCVEGCPGSAIRIDRIAQIDSGSCWGCGRCIDECPERALEPERATFAEILIDGARGVLRKIPAALYVNDVRRVTRLCDCCRDPGPEIAPDVGVLLSTDPVAIDRASTDLAVRAAGEDVFAREHGRDAYAHIREAADRGLGSFEYELREDKGG